MLKCIFLVALLTCIFVGVISSPGDRSRFFVNCVRGCKSKNCTDGKLKSDELPLSLLFVLI